VETAIATGFAVDEAVTWPSVESVARFATTISGGRTDRSDGTRRSWTSAPLRQVAEQHPMHWRRALEQVGDRRTALVVSSGGSIEPAVVAAFPSGDFAAWGTAIHHPEGATLVFDGDRCIDVTVNRWPIP